MASHRLIHIHSCKGRHIKTGQPQIHHDRDFEITLDILNDKLISLCFEIIKYRFLYIKKIEEIAKKIDKVIFPGIQGGPLMHIIAAKAVAFGEALTDEFKEYQAQVVKNAKALAEALIAEGFNLVSGGTDNHLMLIDLRNKGVTGKDVEKNILYVATGDENKYLFSNSALIKDFNFLTRQSQIKDKINDVIYSLQFSNRRKPFAHWKVRKNYPYRMEVQTSDGKTEKQQNQMDMVVCSYSSCMRCSDYHYFFKQT